MRKRLDHVGSCHQRHGPLAKEKKKWLTPIESTLCFLFYERFTTTVGGVPLSLTSARAKQSREHKTSKQVNVECFFF